MPDSELNIFQTSTLNIFLPISKLDWEFKEKTASFILSKIYICNWVLLSTPLFEQPWNYLEKQKWLFLSKASRQSAFFIIAFTSRSKKTRSQKKDKEILKTRNTQIFWVNILLSRNKCSNFQKTVDFLKMKKSPKNYQMFSNCSHFWLELVGYKLKWMFNMRLEQRQEEHAHTILRNQIGRKLELTQFILCWNYKSS